MAKFKLGQQTNNTPHTIGAEIESIPATTILPGVTLLTKNSRATGNAIVIKSIQPPGTAAEYLEQTNQKLWLCETDFGNQMKLTDREIEEMYELGFQQDYESWWNQRLDTIAKNI